LYARLVTLSPAVEQAAAARKQLKEIQPRATGETLAAVVALDHKLQELAGESARRPGAGRETPSLSSLRTRFLTLFGLLQEADVKPSTQAAAAVAEVQRPLPALIERWNAIRAQDIPALNKQLKDANLPEVKLEAAGKNLTAD
jgi:hypothetical protein